MEKGTIKFLNANGTTSPFMAGVKSIMEYTDYPIPILHLSGNAAGMTKDDDVTLNYIYKERTGTCTLKWQGSSSISLAKKNYTIKFDTSFEVVSGWGAQKKYVLKANFVDSSHARNIVCAKLWGQIVKSRTPANTKLNALPNGGAIDGFPVIVSLNGEFHGLYTWNIPKDGWMFGMDGTEQQQAIVCAELNNNGAVCFKGLATMETDANGELDFDLEYSSDDEKGWVLASLNRLISAVKDSDGTNITYGITPYLDWESAIDYFIHAVLIANYDGIHRNYLLATHDGVKWFFTGYDMDVVLGLRAMGKYFYSAKESMTFAEIAANHKVFYLIWKYMRPQLRARYNALRANVMSLENVANMFVDFIADIPSPVYIDDVRMWNHIPSTSANNLSQIITYYDLRCRNSDEWIKNTSGETALPTQVNPNTFAITNSLENCAISNSATTVAKNSSYTATISANSGYELKTVIVKMGGADITSTAYANGVVSILAVTGDVVITATATAIVVSGYTNQVDVVGYTEKTRLSSSGATKTLDYSSVTGYFPASAGDVIRIKGVNFAKDSSYICAYKNDTNKTFIGATSGTNGYTGLGKVTCNGDLATLTLPDNSDIGWVRVSALHADSDATWPTGVGAGEGIKGPCGRLIVTVNQEIT